ncbi:MAG TPA: four helix bundle protein [Bacteroidales bacterium]
MHIVKYFVLKEMSSYKDLEIYNIAFKLSIRVHLESLKLPAYELYEQGSQIRRSSKGIKDAIAEGYGRRRYKADYIKFLTYSIASCDETTNHIITINALYPDLSGFNELEAEYDRLGKKINNYLQYVESSWRT